jgi:hypothetical protein
MSKTHELKTDPDVFDLTARGQKPYEIRFNDRDYQVGDKLRLRETMYSGEQMAEHPKEALLEYTGRERVKYIVSILRGPIYGLQEGWIIMALEG